MVNLIPMAGEGRRFVNEGYACPKPLIEVSGKPMVIQAAQSLPEANRWVFVCRQEHIRNYRIDELLKRHFPAAEIIALDRLTSGQASTCLLTQDLIGDNDELLIGPCDSSAIWNKDKYSALVSGNRTDALIWTFRNNAAVKRDPRMYGWVKTDSNDNASIVSCKVPLSKNPLKDHAIIGTFYFKKAAYFFDAVKQMIAKNRKINNEFYIDEAMNEVIGSGLRVKVFEVEKYIGWGTPNDLKVYQYWERYFNKRYEESLR